MNSQMPEHSSRIINSGSGGPVVKNLLSNARDTEV